MNGLAGVPGSTQEVAWVIAALRARLSSGVEKAPESSATGVDWDTVLVTARRNAIVQLLEPSVRALADEGVPERIVDAFAAEAREIRLANLEHTAALIRVMDVFDGAGIPALPYKGPVLSHVAYGDLGMRRFGDLDVLVRRTDVRRAIDLLDEHGYDPGATLTPRRLDALLRTGHDWSLVKDDRLALEIQWAVADRAHVRGYDVGALLERAHTVRLAGRDIPTLDPTDQVVVLAVHGSIHLWTRLAWVCDLAEAMRNVPGVDPLLALQRARSAGVSRMLLLGVALVERVLGARVATELSSAAARDRDVSRLVSILIPPLLKSGGPDIRSAHQRLGSRVRLADRRFDGLLGAWRALVTPRFSDWEAISLPDPLYPLYYPVRLARLAVFLARRTQGRSGLDVFDAH